MELSFTELGILKMLKTFTDGSKIVKYVEDLLDEIDIPSLFSEVQIYHPLKLIILDLDMPQLNGWEALERIQRLFQKK